MKHIQTLATLLLSISVITVGCSSKDSSFSLLASTQKFSQDIQDNRVDVLWVIDNSGSMAPVQQNLADNFPSFMQNFVNAGFNFNIAVATTDAFMALSQFSGSYDPGNPYWEGLPQEYKARFRDGLGSTHSGHYVLNPLTPNLNDAFITNIMQGTQGSGDERSLQSFKTALQSPLNAGFKRDGVFLAVIIVTDEDDFSHDGTTHVGNYTYPGLHTAASYKDYLDQLTLSSADYKNYSVNSVSINDLDDPQCVGKLHSVSRVAVRVQELVDLTNGKKANLCGDFATELEGLAGNIISLASRFSLGTADPIPESIVVYVNGAQMGSHQWTYDEASNSIIFAEGHTPPSGSDINVTFDPRSLTF